MYTFIFNAESSKEEFYKELLIQVKSLTTGQRNWVTNLANISSLIYHGLNTLKLFKEKPVNWAGFYLIDPSNKDKRFLTLGPFQGKVACTQIKIGKGVCGTAALTRTTQVVPNVDEFPGHITCDSDSKSEIVVPLLLNEAVIGVLDIDDAGYDAFDEQDKIGLEEIVKVLVGNCDWDNLF